MNRRSLRGGILALAGLSALAAACEVGLPADQPETEKKPRVRKLYAPGAGPEEAPATSETETAGTDEAENSAALRAALMGGQRSAAPEAAAPVRRRARGGRTPNVAGTGKSEEGNGARSGTPLVDDAAPGSLSDGAFQSVVRDWTGMKRCLASSAGRLPTSSGALRVAFTIRGDGQVVKSKVVETSNDVARAIAPCVERRARRMRFPAFAQKSEEVEKTAKFVF